MKWPVVVVPEDRVEVTEVGDEQDAMQLAHDMRGDFGWRVEVAPIRSTIDADAGAVPA